MDNSVPNDPKVITYGDLEKLSNALSGAVNGFLMSLEEARAIWKRHLVLVGWKKNTAVEAKPEVSAEVSIKEVKTEIKPGK